VRLECRIYHEGLKASKTFEGWQNIEVSHIHCSTAFEH